MLNSKPGGSIIGMGRSVQVYDPQINTDLRRLIQGDVGDNELVVVLGLVIKGDG